MSNVRPLRNIMDRPPKNLNGCRVLAYVRTDDAVFTGLLRLNVGGDWLGRVPCLAICAFGEASELVVLHCDESWNVLGIQGWNMVGTDAPSSPSEVASIVAKYYQGLEARWTHVP